jgi:hypothetical protein
MSSKLHEEAQTTGMLGVGDREKRGQLLGADYEKSAEEEGLLDESEILRMHSKSSGRWKIISLVFIGCCVGLGWLLNDCLPTYSIQERKSAPPTFELVKYTAAVSSVSFTTPTPTGVLEVFQVYQPVLTPQGATDETVLNDGVENTTTIAAATSSSSCEVLLMDHVFAYSYGIPFVGMFHSIIPAV